MKRIICLWMMISLLISTMLLTCGCGNDSAMSGKQEERTEEVVLSDGVYKDGEYNTHYKELAKQYEKNLKDNISPSISFSEYTDFGDYAFSFEHKGITIFYVTILDGNKPDYVMVVGFMPTDIGSEAIQEFFQIATQFMVTVDPSVDEGDALYEISNNYTDLMAKAASISAEQFAEDGGCSSSDAFEYDDIEYICSFDLIADSDQYKFAFVI